MQEEAEWAPLRELEHVREEPVDDAAVHDADGPRQVAEDPYEPVGEESGSTDVRELV